MKKLLRNKAAAVVMTFALALGMTGCGSKETGSSESTTAENAGGAESTVDDVSVAGETVYPLDITDSTGNVVTIGSEPQKVVSVAPNLTELMYDINAGDKLVGRSEYCDYPAEVSEIETVGNMQTPDIEKIISLDPDVVIVSMLFDDESTKKLDDLGIKVVTLYEEKSVAGVYDLISTLGAIMNRNSEAEACVADMKEMISSVEVAVSGLEAPTVYYVVGYGEYGDYTAGGDTYVGGMIEMAGGDNIAKDISGWTITLEEIVEADPEIIIISEWMKDDFVNSPNYSVLTAVKEGHVYTIDTNILDRQCYRNAEGIKALAMIFHPEAFR